jgi:hypothetical protein
MRSIRAVRENGRDEERGPAGLCDRMRQASKCFGTGTSQDRSFRSWSGRLSPGCGRFMVRLLLREAGIDHESDQVKQEHSVDALALRGDEGRGTLR